MALSDVQICNMALSSIGARANIESLAENSVEARQCSIWYEYSRKQALEAADWNFARRRVALTLHAEDPPDEIWSFRYVYPTDCVAAREIENQVSKTEDSHPFEVEIADDGSKSILTDVEDARLIYTSDQDDPNRFSSFFVDLLAALLASKIAFTITGKLQVKREVTETAGALLRIAPAMDLNEQVKQPPRDADWIRFRGSDTFTD